MICLSGLINNGKRPRRTSGITVARGVYLSVETRRIAAESASVTPGACVVQTIFLTGGGGSGVGAARFFGFGFGAGGFGAGVAAGRSIGATGATGAGSVNGNVGSAPRSCASRNTCTAAPCV